MKTIPQWLSLLIEKRGGSDDKLKFDWDSTPEGYPFWNQISEYLFYGNEYLPTDPREVDHLKNQIEQLKRLSQHNNGEFLLGWMNAHRKVSDERDKLEKKLKLAEACIRDGKPWSYYCEHKGKVR
jgi:hypothetical protein